MGWIYYTFLRATTDPAAVYQSPYGHALVPYATVTIGRNDETTFSVPLDAESNESPNLRYRFQFEDLDGNVYFSAPFGVCF